MSAWFNSLPGYILVGVLMTVACGQTCPEGWYTNEITMSTSHCYLYVPTHAKFDDAKSSCEMEGGQLASPQNAIDISILLQIIQVRVEDSRLRKDIWLGVKKEDNEWRDVNGAATYLSWQEGYPEGNGECLVMFYETGTMKNKGCHHKSAFVCKIPIDLTFNLGTCDQTLLPDHMSIKLVGTATTGTVAYPVCADGYIKDTAQPSSSSISCHGAPGLWHRLESLPQCIVERCPDLQLTHLEELTEGGVYYQTVRNFTCPQGSDFNPELNLVTLEYISVKCNGQGEWEGENVQHLFDSTCTTTVTANNETLSPPANAASEGRAQSIGIQILVTYLLFQSL